LIPELSEESGGSGAVRECPEGTERLLGTAGEACHHLVGVDPNSFELLDELSNNFRVRHPAPDWGWRRRSYVKRLLGSDGIESTAGRCARQVTSGCWRRRRLVVVVRTG